MKKAPIVLFSFINILGITASCGASYTHKTSDQINDYAADVDHDGIIDDNHKHLTWQESFDELMNQSNSINSLNDVANKLRIDEDEPERTALARYEVLHEAEELLMHTGVVMPLYNYRDPFMIKPNITGIYTCDLGTKMFDKLLDTSGSTKEFALCVGTKSDTLDPAINVDSATAMILSNCSVGIKRWDKVTDRTDKSDETGFKSKIVDGCATTKKQIVVDRPVKEEEKDKFISIKDCPDLINKSQQYQKKYIGTARWTINLKDGFKWSDDSELVSDDFIWTWSRAACKFTGSWSSMFDCVCGYKAWHVCADKTVTGKPIKDLDEDQKKEWNELSETEKESYNENGEKAIPGLIKHSDKEFVVQLINDCPYFDELLTFPVFLPLKKENVEKDTNWWTKPETYLSNGPYKLTKIDNRDAGTLELSPNPRYPIKDEMRPTKLTFSLLDDDTSMLSKYKMGQLQMIDAVPSGSIDDVKATMPDQWKVVDQIALYYMIFNVNDNTFDYKADMSESQREALRKAMILLINRTDICNSIVKNGANAADGWVSTGVIEKCVPVYDETKGKYVALRDKDTNELVSLDWHYRNKDLYDDLLNGKCFDERTGSYNMEKRNPKFDEKGHLVDPKQHAGGFYPTTTSDITYDPNHHDSPESRAAEERAQRSCIELAKKYAAQAGVMYVGDDDTGRFENFPDVKVTINTGTGHSDIAERMQAYYNLFGINLSIEQQEWNAFNHNKNAGNFALARNGWVADFSDARTYLDICTSKSANNDGQLGKKSWHRSR